MQISIAWWNTSLSPLGEQRATDEQKKIALDVVRYLTCDLNVDCLALGEVTLQDLNFFLNTLNLTNYAAYDGTVKEGRLQFDTGALYRTDSLHLVNNKTLIPSKNGHSFKLANRLDFIVTDLNIYLHLFISHWPSRLACDKNNPDRHFLGMKLREAVQAVNEESGLTAYTVLLGDYNDEPFDSSLAEHLLAVRDRRLVRKRPELLYNPFWRHLGEPQPYVKDCDTQSCGGSCFHKGGTETQWRTFDQIIFSSPFLGGYGIHLNEKFSHILRLESFLPHVLKTTEIFDHFPVISVIETEG
ncbi:hypothetical protein GMLC_16150 [Geomonas limicola]|uniref:Endonuclease/exonuclease/phosphatase domain-containing protein n=1 Tax=Geomonas limicola TaxID=2740186 RepID=A0A6V8N654_9BACT|nr:endonuclease/exonuclease/phosphatase family protein [Geomonas limicola]GFO68036.1 hypothetical protein GMLC_16150 [Geomonas limicola]